MGHRRTAVAGLFVLIGTVVGGACSSGRDRVYVDSYPGTGTDGGPGLGGKPGTGGASTGGSSTGGAGGAPSGGTGGLPSGGTGGVATGGVGMSGGFAGTPTGGVGGGPPCADTCVYANNGECNEPGLCALGTDCSDCGILEPCDTCYWARNGVCDEPNVCPPGTDCTDCAGGSECFPDGSSCDRNGDCCGFYDGSSGCVGFVGGEVLCSAYCFYNSDCESGCCVTLTSGDGACAPSYECSSGCRGRGEVCDGDYQCCELDCQWNSVGPNTCFDPSCNNQCGFAYDGDCDDGGPGSDFSLCDLGSDCGDCGPRWIEEGAL
jgi:hypothetical protein